ncbi:GGDEF domain-containing protein [Mycobacterium yunnanensis]|uniref:GGDEF domain-containing protein n=1 Tax=Mycobacterium yunnanensis TaxID=368477 RepID=A0A9X2YZR6_9MYCO|nr:GGDEF domain-containing protein [Mycobacterium yunnanensis]MCV7420496.1 GGDEF domain-containing protein [Mycobacterium yunnanensis]
MPILMIASPAGPRSRSAAVAALIVAILIVAMAIAWTLRRTRRPSRVQSKMFSMICTGSVATMCLFQPQPLIGLLGCTAFAVLTTYISIFHTAGYMLVNLAAGAGVAAVLAMRIVESSGDVALAVSALIVLTALNVAVPLAVQSLLRALGMDLAVAERDPLTGLLNRRAFFREVATLLDGHRGAAAGGHVVVIMVDLDKFKALNDRHGHAAGDRALMLVARAMQRSCPRESALGRLGGEEFVIAVVSEEPDSPTAHRIRQAIANLPMGVTASVGTATAALDTMCAGPLVERSLTALIDDADDAMYRAKRSGGDRVAHHRPDTPDHA